jgi:hypothetical protein
MTLQERVAQLVEQHGSLRAAGRAVQIDPGYLHRLACGDKARPGKLILKRLGLREVRTYELTRTNLAEGQVNASSHA